MKFKGLPRGVALFVLVIICQFCKLACARLEATEKTKKGRRSSFQFLHIAVSRLQSAGASWFARRVNTKITPLNRASGVVFREC
jgi:hypothetical protein